MAWIQANRSLAIATPLGEDVLLLRGVEGTEELGRLFSYQLDLVSEDPALSYDDILGQNVTIGIELVNGETRYLNGFISTFSQLDPAEHLMVYSATMVPWLWFLTRTADCRIFQEKTVPEIVQDIFREHGFTDFDDALTGTYEPREYCVQYRETDFNFVSRLLEEEGIYYFFEHEDGRHTLVMADDMGAHQAFEGYESVVFRPTSEQGTHIEHIFEWRPRQAIQPGAVALNDFDFQNPQTALEARAAQTREHAASDFEVYDYPGKYKTYGDGERYARIRLEATQVAHSITKARTTARGIATGYTFQFEEHPREDQAGEYLVTATELKLTSDLMETGDRIDSGDVVFSGVFTAMNTQQPFRPSRRTPKPTVKGPQTAIVVGPSGEEIHTDEYGRVRVQFPWDRYGEADENSSCWIRCAQLWAGKEWGAIYLPRIGQEVVVDFLEGDPDRPIITGRVYNGQNMPPYALPGEKTKSTTKSNTSQGGGGFNEIRFEDKAGEEQVFIHAQKNMDIRVTNDRFENIGHDRHLVIGNDQLEQVGNNRHETVGADLKEEIGKDRHVKVSGKKAEHVKGSLSLTVGGDVIAKLKKNHKEETTQTYHLKAASIKLEASAGIELKCGGGSIVVTPAAIFIAGGPLVNINSGAGPPVAPVVASVVSPAKPTAPEEADVADPGAVAAIRAEQLESKSGKYGAVQLAPHQPDEEKTSWVEIELVDEEDSPVPGAAYRITLPDGTVAEGTLDENGFARVDGIDPGECQITFPELDEEAWEPA